MRRRGVVRRSAVAGLALITATTIIGAAPGGVAAAAPSAPSTPSRAHAPNVPSGGVVKDRYIVVLKDGKASAGATRTKAASLAGAFGGSVRQVYTSALRGFSAQLNATQAKRLAAHADVASIHPVRIYSASDTQTNPPSWGLDRVDQTVPARSRSYTYPNTAGNVTAYVIDSGLRTTHPDFGGRASSGYDFIDNDADSDDCSGHGTHVAGTVGGTTFGVAKQVNLVGVRVLDCEGSGTTESVVGGVDWVTDNAVEPAVANMSLGTTVPDPVVDLAVQASIASGVSYAVAAGNGTSQVVAQDACLASPARVAAAITVGATDNVDFRTYFSNYGSCLDLFAPGANITSADLGGGSVNASGTSMASPHVAGAAALLLSANPTWTPQQVRDALVTGAISGAVQDPQGSSNRLLRVGAIEPARSAVALRALVNNRYVAPGNGTQRVIANLATVTAADRFDQVDAGSGYVALRSRATGKYLTADGAGTLPLITRGLVIDIWERFQVFNNADGSVSFKAVINGKFVSADGGGSRPLIANGPAVSAWERFEYVAPAPIVAIKAVSNQKYVSADGGGSRSLIANGPAVSSWERFELIDAGEGYFALKAIINARYVTALAAGAQPLIANRTVVGPWEKFFLWDYSPDGSISFVADINFKAVTTPAAGASPLIASRTLDPALPNAGIGAWESFVIEAIV